MHFTRQMNGIIVFVGNQCRITDIHLLSLDTSAVLHRILVHLAMLKIQMLSKV